MVDNGWVSSIIGKVSIRLGSLTDSLIKAFNLYRGRQTENENSPKIDQNDVIHRMAQRNPESKKKMMYQKMLRMSLCACVLPVLLKLPF